MRNLLRSIHGTVLLKYLKI